MFDEFDISEESALEEPVLDVVQEPKEEPVPLGRGLGILKVRPYQTEAVDSIYEGWIDHQFVAIEMATGLGKTILAAEAIVRWPGQGRILFIAHIQELIHQAAGAITAHTGEIPSIEMGVQSECLNGHPILDKSRVLVASIQTMIRRMEKFDPKNFDLVIIDEFHHGAAVSYRKLWQYLSEGNPNIKGLGITATLFRTDKLTLSCMAESCCFRMGIRDGIDEGWLVPIQQKYVVVDGLDFSACRTVAKDLNEGDLEQVMMGGKADDGMSEEERRELLIKQERMLHAVAAPAVEEAAGKCGLVFCVTVEHAIRMAEVLRRYPNVTAEVVHGKTPTEDRKDTVEKFKKGAIQFLVGVGCFLEGFDAPNVQVLVMARPTKSQSLYIQMIGRSTRPVSGLVDSYDTPEERKAAIATSEKSAAVVLDFVGNSGKHKLISTADVFAGDMPPEFVAAAIKEMKETGEAEDIRAAAWRKKEEHDEEVRKAQEAKRRQEEERRKKAQAIEEARRAKIKARPDYHAKPVDPFGHDHAPERVQSTFRGGSSDGQIRYLACLGVPEETAMKWSGSQAGAVISKLSNQTGPDYIMRFGKHQGKMLRDIPFDYLKWAGQNLKDDKFQQNLETYRQQVIQERRKAKGDT